MASGNAPWAENPSKVVIEFKKGNDGCKRKVSLTHTRQQGIPPQLANRVDPKAWDALICECERLATQHPYIESANVDCCCQNFVAMFTFCIVGFGCFQGDAGDYDAWLRKVQQALVAHTPYFQQAGCTLSVKSVHGGFWIQIDVGGAPPPSGGPANLGAFGPPPLNGYGVQPVQPMQQMQQPIQPQYQQPGYAQTYAQQTYAQQTYAQQTYAQPPYAQQRPYGKPV